MSNDELNNIFNDAFKSETIAFDTKAWDEMQALLDRERRRKAFWIWLSGGASMGIVALVCVFMLFDAQAVYQPRLTDFDPVNRVTIPSNNHSSNTTESNTRKQEASRLSDPAHQSTTTAQDAVAVSNEPQANAVSQGTKSSSANDPKSNAIPTQSDHSSPSSGPEPQPLEAKPIAFTISEDDDQSIDSESIDAERTDLSLLPIMDLAIDSPNDEFETRDEEEPEFKAPLEPYVRFGLSNTLTIGIGQIGGIGITQPIGNRLLISGEALLARDHTAYFIEQESVNYGFDRRSSTLRIWTKEMVTLEVPLFLHYRLKRFKIGTGVSAGLLLSSKVQEEKIDRSSQSNILSDVKEVGYVNWNTLQPLQISIPIDLQYQLNERYFVGSRYNFGLTDGFSETPSFDRRHRLELYIKMKIQR